MKFESNAKFKKGEFLKDDIQNLRCSKCNNWLKLVLDSKFFFIDNILIEFEKYPFLKCEKCSIFYLSNITKRIALHYFNKASKNSRKHVKNKASVGEIRNKWHKEIEFYKKVKYFKYDPIDYIFIPGLRRSYNEGYLTPVFFSKDVLSRYYNHPNYLVTFGSDTYGSIRMPGRIVSFGVNRNEKIIMWLGEVIDLPKSEKKYLLAHNEKSDHDIGSEFYEGQIEAKFTDFTKEQKIIEISNKLSHVIFKKWQIKLLVLSNESISILRKIKQPIFYNREEIGKNLEALNKLLIERINSNDIKNDLVDTFQIDKDTLKGKGSLKIFQLWLEKRCNSESISKIVTPLFVLYDFRQIVDHVHSDKNKKRIMNSCLRRLSLNQTTNIKEFYETLLFKLSNCYQKLIERINK
jgi:hypothetical protein